MRRGVPGVLAVGLLLGWIPNASGVAPRGALSQSGNAAELYESSMRLAEASYDSEAHLIVRPTQSHSNARGSFMVRESSWYALGLLMRDKPGDRELAAGILDTVLANQYQAPGRKWFGTFKRTPEEREPEPGTLAFTGYDPNWRHFIGTTFELILIEYPDRIPAQLSRRLYAAIDLAVRGEQADGRLKPTYSNIALMYGALWDFAAHHDQNAAWQRDATAWNEEVYRLFREHNTFSEYNSPTYYGVDLYGLALWRRFGSTARLRLMGRNMEAALWTDIAAFYQPRLRNLSGPYDRSYGMDMETYVSVTGVWLRSVMNAASAPLPEQLTPETDHVADLWFAPQIVLLGARIPKTAMANLRRFRGPHLVTGRIDEQRVATAWIGERAIWGGEATSLSKDAGPETQFHPATVQWRTPSGSIGWISLTLAPNLNAFADRDGITIETDGDVSFRLNAAAFQPGAVTAGQWTLPGMTVDIETDAAFSSDGSPADQSPIGITVTYRRARRIRLRLRPTPTDGG